MSSFWSIIFDAVKICGKLFVNLVKLFSNP